MSNIRTKEILSLAAIICGVLVCLYGFLLLLASGISDSSPSSHTVHQYEGYFVVGALLLIIGSTVRSKIQGSHAHRLIKLLFGLSLFEFVILASVFVFGHSISDLFACTAMFIVTAWLFQKAYREPGAMFTRVALAVSAIGLTTFFILEGSNLNDLGPTTLTLVLLAPVFVTAWLSGREVLVLRNHAKS